VRTRLDGLLVLPLLVVLGLAPLDGGCGATTRGSARRQESGPAFSVPVQSFPTRDSLRTSLPPPGPISSDAGVVVARWDIAPTSLALAPSPFDALYAGVAATRPTAQRSEAFACLATEIARFMATNGGLPTDALRSYVSSRCGVTSTTVAVSAFPADLHGAPTDQALLEQLGPQLLEHTTEMIPEAADRVGFGVARVGNRFVVAVAAGLAQTEIIPSHPVAEGGRIRFTVRAALPVERVLAFANQGETGVAACTVAGSSPDIAIDCPFVPDGDRARIEVALREGDSVMLRPLALLVGLTDAAVGLTYETRAGATTSPLDAATLVSTVLPLLNGIRTRAGLMALALDEAQSAANTEVAPSFFASHDPVVQDQVLLYAMAGWEVAGEVRDGRSTSVATGGATDASSWLYAALEEPIERYVLLDPEARVIAFGVAATGAGASAIVSTYRFFDADQAAERARILGTLTAARAAVGLGPPTFVAIPELEQAADAVESGGLGPDEALGRAVDATLPRFGRLRPFFSATSDLDHLELPPELVSDRGGRLGFSVVHWRQEGSAWGLYLLLGVVLE
jgi:hypothetical protein